MFPGPIHPLRPAMTAVILAALSAPAMGQTQSGEAGRSEIVRVRITDSDARIFQVFLDRQPATLLYRKDAEVGFEIVADEDGIECRRDIAVVTTDGRLADLPGINLCESNWIVSVDASRLSGGRTGTSEGQETEGPAAGSEPQQTTGSEPAESEAPPARTESAPAQAQDSAAADDRCGWLAIMSCRRDKPSAEKESIRIMGGVSVIATDDYEGLNPGLYCAAQGPYATQQEAEENADFFRRKAAPQAYTKRACEAGGASAGSGRQQAEDGSQADEGTPARQSINETAGWSYTPPSGNDNPAAVLSFNDARTGALELVGACSPGAGEIALTFYRAPEGAAEGSTVGVTLATDAFRQGYQATIGAPDADTGFPVATVTVSAGDRLWEALASHYRLSVEQDGLRPYNISLRGSSGPVRSFSGTCAAADRGQDGQDALSGGPNDGSAPDDGPGTGDAAGAGGVVPAAATYACRQGPNLEVFFPRSGNRAVVSVEGDEPIVLNRSGQGTAFRSGPFELAVSGDGATWSEGRGDAFTCRAQ